MRKAIAVILMVVLAFTLIGCGKEKDPVELFKEAQENMSKAEGVYAEGAATMDLEMEGIKFSFAATANMVYLDGNEKKDPLGQMKVSYNVTLLEEYMQGIMYVKGKTAYVDMDGEKLKTTIDSTNVIENALEADDIDIPSIYEYIKDAQKKDDKVILKIDGTKYTKDFFEANKEEFTDEEMKGLMTGLGDITIEATIKKGNFTDYKIKISAKVDSTELLGEDDEAEL